MTETPDARHDGAIPTPDAAALDPEEAGRLAELAAAHIEPSARPFGARTAFVLGSGLGAIAEAIRTEREWRYAELPGFPIPQVAGHDGRLRLGHLEGKPVIIMQGRQHYYEGQGFAPMTTAIRALKLAGVERIVLTCSAGSLNPAWMPGSLAVIRDHINLLGANPLIGPNAGRFGPRFVDMTAAYDPDLRHRIHQAALRDTLTVHEGVYAAMAGPNFETPAEIRMLRTLGADLVGMSTVPECLIARHCGLSVAGIAVVTNLAAGLGDQYLSHEETLAAAGVAEVNLLSVLTGFLKGLGN